MVASVIPFIRCDSFHRLSLLNRILLAYADLVGNLESPPNPAEKDEKEGKRGESKEKITPPTRESQEREKKVK